MDVDFNYDSVNVETESADPNSLLSHYRRLIQLRADYAALRSGEWILLSTSHPAIYAYLRCVGASTLLVLLNFSQQQAVRAELSCEASPLAVGEYQATDLLTGRVVAPLSVLSEGRFSAYIPLPSLEPLIGYVFSVKEENNRCAGAQPRPARLIRRWPSRSELSLLQTSVSSLALMPGLSPTPS